MADESVVAERVRAWAEARLASGLALVRDAVDRRNLSNIDGGVRHINVAAVGVHAQVLHGLGREVALELRRLWEQAANQSPEAMSEEGTDSQRAALIALSTARREGAIELPSRVHDLIAAAELVLAELRAGQIATDNYDVREALSQARKAMDRRKGS
jgi:hypothetical protein